MTIYFASQEPEICHIFSKEFPEHSCFIFTGFASLMDMIKKLSIMPDLLVLDYLLYNHDIFDIFKEMNKKSVYIPLIFYNDPTLILPKRSLHWKHIIEYQKPDFCDFTITEEYEKIFSKIEEMVESPELSPYIPLMQPHKKLPKEIINSDYYKKMLTTQEEDKLIFLKNNLSENQFFLFNLFYENLDNFLSLDTIIKKYKADNREMTENSLKVVISRLRKKLRTLEISGFYIESHKNNYCLLEK